MNFETPRAEDWAFRWGRRKCERGGEEGVREELARCEVEGEVRESDHLYIWYPADVDAPRWAAQDVHVRERVEGWNCEVLVLGLGDEFL